MQFHARLALWALAALWGAVPVHAQPAPATPTRYEAASPRGFVWEARKGEQRIVLVGTIHVGRPEFAQLPAALLSRARTAAVIALEADPTNAQAVAETMQRYALYGVGDTPLNEQISAGLRKRLEALLPRYGMNPAVIWRMKPWFVAMNLSMAEFARAGMNPAQGTETQLLALAARDGKRVVEIEGIEAQLKVFDDALATEQMAFLEQTIASIESGSAQGEAKALADAWAAGDAAAMERMFAELQIKARQSAAERFFLEQLLENRNVKMLEAIERYATRPAAHLVAVGSLHYFGPKGLLNDLRQRGWTVTEVR